LAGKVVSAKDYLRCERTQVIAARILAKPVSETYATDVSPDFDEREYQKWIDTYQDLPEDIITTLAENRERNAMIADTYAQHRERYGKTIMFADRWYQCEQLEALLEARGVRAGSIYSHVGGEPTSVAERNKRDKGFKREGVGAV
jgi:superfamily II DNA/RNA helicase